MMTLKLLVAIVLLNFAFIHYIYSVYDPCGSTDGKSSIYIYISPKQTT